MKKQKDLEKEIQDLRSVMFDQPNRQEVKKIAAEVAKEEAVSWEFVDGCTVVAAAVTTVAVVFMLIFWAGMYSGDRANVRKQRRIAEAAKAEKEKAEKSEKWCREQEEVIRNIAKEAVKKALDEAEKEKKSE